jgi:hypothetical protein
MKKKYFQEKTAKGVIGSASTSRVWFNRMNQIQEGIANADGTPNGLEQGYVHAGSSQALNIEETLPDDDTGSAPPQSPPSTILAFGTYVNTSSMGTQGNVAIELPHTYATNLPGVFGKVMGNKRCRLNGDMASAFKKLIESSKKLRL